MSGSSMSGRRFLTILLVIAAVAFVGRVIYITAVTNHRDLYYDEIYYMGSADRLADGDWFKAPSIFGPADQESADHPPLTALTLAPVSRFSDNSETALRITVALAGIGVVVLLGLIGRDLAGARAGLIAAGLAAVYPNLWANDGLILSETFATLGSAAAVFCTYRLIRGPTWRNAAGAGVACAIAMLSRGELVLLVPLLVLPAVFMIPDVARALRLRLAGVVALAAMVVIAPWVAYNLSRFEEPVFLSHGDGGALIGANCDTTYAGSELGYWYGYCFALEIPDPGEPSVYNRQRRDRAIEYARDHLSRLPVVAAARVGRLWGVFKPFAAAKTSRGEGKPEAVSLAGWAASWVLIGLGAGGAVILRRRRVPLFPILAPIGIVTVVAIVFYGSIRFRVAAEVSLVVLAAIALDALVDRRSGARAGA
ncbi:MAG TPA: glycosyltransferase family 39 protein [Acidimicrobiia bacterium]|nr:glycosyltransferase family 39 protein [Acidimicrobiia bacterium]